MILGREGREKETTISKIKYQVNHHVNFFFNVLWDFCLPLGSGIKMNRLEHVEEGVGTSKKVVACKNKLRWEPPIGRSPQIINVEEGA